MRLPPALGLDHKKIFCRVTKIAGTRSSLPQVIFFQPNGWNRQDSQSAISYNVKRCFHAHCRGQVQQQVESTRRPTYYTEVLCHTWEHWSLWSCEVNVLAPPTSRHSTSHSRQFLRTRHSRVKSVTLDSHKTPSGWSRKLAERNTTQRKGEPLQM